MNEVEITVKSNDKSDFASIAAKAKSNMTKSVKSGLDEIDRTTNAKFKEIGEKSGTEFGKSFDPALTKWGDGMTKTIDVKVKTKFHEVGQHGGSMLTAGLRDGLKGAETVGADVGTKVASSAGSSLASAFREVGAYGMAILGAVLLASAPIIGMAAAGGIVLAFGAGLAGLGLVAAFHLKSVQKEFKSFQKFLGSFMNDIGKPFVETWMTIFNVAGSVLKKFQPILKGAFKDFVAPAVTKFVTELGRAFMQLAPAIRPMAKAFSDLMGAIGPQLPGIFDQIAQALIQLANTVSSNPELFASLVTDALMLVVYGLKLVNALAQIDRFMNRIAGTKDIFVGFGTIGMTIAFVKVLWGWLKSLWGYIKRAWKFTVSLVDKVSSVAHRVKSAITGIKNKTVHIAQSGAAAVFNWVSKLISTIRRFVGKTVRVGAKVFGLGGVLNLIGAIRRVVGKTVNIVAHKFGFAHGGIVGGHAAEGGPRSNQILVGEGGPEIVDLPAGSRVHSNADSRRMAAGQGGALKVEVEWVGGNAGDKFMTWLKENIRIRVGSGPNSVQKALGG